MLFEYTTGSKMLNLETEDNSYSDFSFWYSRNGKINDVTAGSTGVSYGIYLYENEKVNLTNSEADGGGTGNTGVYDYLSRAVVSDVKATGFDYGFYLNEPILGYELRDSTANGNDYGVYVSSNTPTSVYQAKINNNVANDNSSYGFYADARTKGSGNKAKDNGTANCFHVKC